ncbi:MAG: hypothetical protein EKK54_06275 [Neisseriaceae bacterium]|nr:MAG: hypothetical protein EKK54_06275 [Neisseriaceae bacterium]
MNDLLIVKELFLSNFKYNVPYLLRKLVEPELANYLPNECRRYMTFILQKQHYTSEDSNKIIQEIKITYRFQNKIMHKYFIFSNNGFYVYFDTRDKKIDFKNYDQHSSWLMIPFQSCGLGSLVMYECISYRDKYCPNLFLSPLTLSDDSHHPTNETRRNKLYSNCGYKIEKYKATHMLPIKYPIDKLFGFDAFALKNYTADMHNMLGDLFNYSNSLF